MGKTAFVFAGQGSQSAGMCKDLYETIGSVKTLFDMAETNLRGITELIFNGPKEQLDITINTQPAVFLADLACATALTDKGIEADGAAGFSLGEIPAACYAGLMDNKQAFEFVCYRAEAMQKCADKHKGSMFAVLKLDNGKVESICAAPDIQGSAFPVNYNCPGQIVVACADSIAERLQTAVTEAGGKALKLAVSGAFHSPFMNEASEKVFEYLEDKHLGETHIPLYSNLTAAAYETGDNQKELLAKQINNPVLWHMTIGNMIAGGFDTFIETGPGKTLTGLIKKINPDVKTFNVSDVKSLENTVKELCNA